ncbi:Leucine-rich repeat containing protein [Entamoeba marina]
MTVVKYFDNVETLKKFIRCSKSCTDAVNRTKINPNYGINTLGVAISSSRPKNLEREMKLFKGLDTLYIDYATLEKFKPEDFDDIKLFYIHKFIMKNNDYPILKSIANRISHIGIDTSYTFNPDFSTLTNLQEITIRVGEACKDNIVSAVFNGILKLPYLHKVVISCDSQFITNLREKAKLFPPKVNVIFKVQWIRHDDIKIVEDLVNSTLNPVGITMINFDTFHSFFLRPNVVLTPFVPYNFQVSSEMSCDKHFYELLSLYNPYKIEIQGGVRSDVTIPKDTVLDFTCCSNLHDLFLNEARYTNDITIKIPKSLDRMFINNTNSIKRIEGLNESQLTNKNKEEYRQIQNNVTEYMVKWDENDWTWETQQDIETSDYGSLITTYRAAFSLSNIPQKILGKGIQEGELYVRWKDGTYSFVKDIELLEKYPELAI